MKTHKAVQSKFKVTANGKLLRRKAGKRHLNIGKSSKRKRQLGKAGLVFPPIAHTYKRMMGVL
jgi:large subunit ribosomal protein L35